LVVVALVVVEFEAVKFWRVVEPEARKLTEVTVPVAVRLAKVRSPETRALPWTERGLEGDVVPIPTLPPKKVAA
jgi:hypothetical protein